MSESTPTHPDIPASPGDDVSYDVVLLVEEQLSLNDARQVLSLHQGVEEPVHYHLLLPVEDAAGRVEATLGSLDTGDVMASPDLPVTEVDPQALRTESERRAAASLAGSTAALGEAGGRVATVRAVEDRPVDALAAVIAAVGGREAIIVTRSHLVAEFFHVDWTSQARRHLGDVPVLHLVEHETFREQAGGPEGATGL